MFYKKLKNEKWFAYTVATCAAVVLFVVLSNLHIFFQWFGNFFDVLSPVLGGIVFAYIMSPICDLFERTLFSKVKPGNIAKVASVATGVLLVLCVFVILLVALIPQLIDSVITFTSNIGDYSHQLRSVWNNLSKWGEETDVDISYFSGKVYSYIDTVLADIPQRLNEVASASYNFGVSVANIALSFILAVYFLLDRENLMNGLRKVAGAFLTQKRYNTIVEFWSRCNNILIRYITFDIVDGFIVGILNGIFMAVLSMPYSVLISVIVGVTNLAPTFGPIVGGLFGGLILLLANPLDALAFIVFTVVLQTIDGYFIKPRLFGSSLGVPAVWILVTIIVGGNIFGVAGILLAIPFAAIMTYVYRDILEQKLDEKKRTRDEAEKKEAMPS
ncbi:MAG: AI-2E family transporter [Lachnospiraceae bacterium]|nr:AI-2E family transporter [Lachnospiraceae bacterium]